MDTNEHGRLSNMTLTHKLKQKNNVLVAVLHFTVTVGFIIGINVSLIKSSPVIIWSVINNFIIYL